MRKKIESNGLSLVFIAVFIISTILFSLSGQVGPFMNSNLTIAIFFTVIMGISGLFIVILMLKLKKISKSVQDSISFLNGLDRLNIDAEFSRISNHFKNSMLKDSWKQFDKSIRRIKSSNSEDGEVQIKYFSTVDANYYFNEDLMMGQINSRLHNYIPSLMTAIGIFGTFLGLVIGLQNLDLSQVENTKRSISLLISGVKISFKSSLYGVAYSIILTFYQKAYMGYLDNYISTLALKLDKLFPMNTQEDGVKEIYLELEKQTSSLQKLATDFAEEVGKKLDNSLQENLTPILYKLNETTEKLVNITLNNNIAEDVGEKFNLSIQQNLGPALEKLGSATERLVTISENSNENAISSLMQNMGEMFSTATNGEMERLKNSLGEITSKNESMFDKFSDSIEKVQQMIDSQEKIIAETNSSANHIEKTNNNVESVTKELEEIIKKLSQYSQTQQLSNDDYRLLIGQIKENIDYQNQYNEKSSNLLKENYNSLQMQKQIFNDLNETTKNLNIFNNEFKPVLDNIKDNLGNFGELSVSINERFINTFSKLQEHYNSINGSIDGVFGVLNISVEQLKEDVLGNIGKVNEQFLDIAGQLNAFTKTSSNLTLSFQEFASSQESSQTLWKTYKESFDDLNTEIKDGVTDYTINVKNSLSDIFKQYDDHISSVLGSFDNSIEQLRETIEELSEVNSEEVKGEAVNAY
ncbi:anti-phage ZorAB system protein ZorA [Clostridium sp.]